MKFRPIVNFIRKHLTKILAGCAITSEAIAMYFMHKEAPVVHEKLKQLPENATAVDKIKTAAPVYLPAFLMMLTSMGCIVGGTIYGDRQQALLASLYSASEVALANYQKKVVEKLGADKAQELHDDIAKDLIAQRPVNDLNIYATGKGDQLFYDTLSGRYFTSTKNEVEQAEIRYNKKIISQMWLSVNDWYDELGLEHIGLGETWGWNVDHLLELGYSAQATNDGRTCWVIGYYGYPVLYK